MNEQNFCRECERPISPEDCHTFDGALLCDECYRTLTAECDCCGTRIWREDSEGNESIVLCQRCWDDRYTTCEECGTLIPNEEAWYEDGGDFPYCYECFNRKRNRPIKQYNYKPEPIFYGADSDFYLGVELEIDRGGEDKENAQQILDVANHKGEHIYCKHDGHCPRALKLSAIP